MTFNDPSSPEVVEVLSMLNDTHGASPIAPSSSTDKASLLVTPSKQTSADNKENVTPTHEANPNASSKYLVSPDSIVGIVSALGL